MASEEAGADDKTEEASTHRRDELKRQGDVLQSREVVSVALLLAATGALYATSRWTVGGTAHLFEESFAELSTLGTQEWTIETAVGIAKFAMRAFAYIVGPVAVFAAVAAIVSTFAQIGFIWTTRPLELDLEKLDPVKGMSRIFSLSGVFEMFKAILKFVVVGVALYPFLKQWAGESGGLYQSEAGGLARFLGAHLIQVLFVSGLAMMVLSAIDYGFQRFRYEQRIRMTKEEVREERKQVEGNPQLKARIRSMQRQVGQRRMMDAVKKADVVVTNPTHIAVALLYDRENMFAPRVVAKGADHMAEQIKKIAREAGVPCVENVPLARAMFKALKIGQFISRDLYNAVAEVLAYVYRLKGKNS